MTRSIKRVTPLAELRVSPDTPIRTVLSRMNQTFGLFQLVMDDADHLIGTITDGDIRRGLVGGITLDEPASACLKHNPIVGRPGAAADNRKALYSVRSIVPFLPIVDERGVVREVLVLNDIRDADAVGLVMAGGRGRRLGDLTRERPKPLVSVAGRPMLEYVLSALEAAGIRQVNVSVNYLGDQIIDYCSRREGPARIEYLREEMPLGTAGALSLIDTDVQQPVVVINGDVVSRVDIAALLSFHKLQDFDASLAVATYETRIPYGVVRTDEHGLCIALEEKPSIQNFVAAGIYVINPEVRALVPRGQPFDMPDLLNLAQRLGMRVGIFPLHEYWRDVGRPADLEAAEAEAQQSS